MKCIFCQKEYELQDMHPEWGTFFKCLNHKYEVESRTRHLSHKKGDCTQECNCPTLVEYEVSFDYKNYRIIFYLEDNKFKICDSKTPRIVVLTLPFIPNITPENVEQKLSIYITFS